jgi:DNA-directed RNA polymerase subunit M/transcription elongation factor TFIIS
MVITHSISVQCPKCQEKYQGTECIKHNTKNGEERVTWRKIKIGEKVQKFTFSGKGDQQFGCTKCHSKVNVL